MTSLKEDVFIQKLLEETYEFLPENETAKDPSDLLSYFNVCNANQASLISLEKLKSTLSAGYMHSYFELGYNSSLKCFRLKMGETVLDIPRNWGVFSNVYQSIQEGKNTIITINSKNDVDGLLEVLTPQTNSNQSITIIHCFGNVLFVFNKKNADLTGSLKIEIENLLEIKDNREVYKIAA